MSERIDSILKDAKIQFPPTNGSYKDTASEVGKLLMEQLSARSDDLAGFVERLCAVEKAIKTLAEQVQRVANEMQKCGVTMNRIEQHSKKAIGAAENSEASHIPDDTELKGE